MTTPSNLSFKEIFTKHSSLASLLMSVIVVFIFFLYYINFELEKSIILSFDVNAQNDITYQVFYTTTQNSGFNEPESQKQFIAKGTQTVTFEIKVPKIYHLRLDPGSNPGQIFIKDLVISGDKTIDLIDKENLSVINVSEFEVKALGNAEEGDLAFQKVLSLNSNHPDPMIIVNKPLNIESIEQLTWDYQNYLGLLLLIGVFYLVFKKIITLIIDYSSKSNNNKNNSCIGNSSKDIRAKNAENEKSIDTNLASIKSNRSRNSRILNVCFVVVFLVIIFLPLLSFDKSEISEVENRRLATFPQAKVGEDFNENFGKEFNSWFNDRFLGRSLLIEINIFFQKLNNVMTKTKFVCFNNGDNCFVKDYHKKGQYYDEYKNFPKVLDEIQKKLEAKRVFALFYPVKFTVYCDWSYYDKSKCETTLDKEIEKLSLDFNNNPKVTLKGFATTFKDYTNSDLKDKSLLYFMDDHHATEFAHNLVQSNLEEIKELNNQEFYFEDKFCVREEYGQFCRKRGQTYKYNYLTRDVDKLTVTYKYLSFSDRYKECVEYRDEQINIPNNPLRGLRVFTNKCVHNNLKALVFGNSFSENFSRVLATRISKVVRIRTHGDYAPQAADVRVFPYIVNSHTLEFDPDYVFSVNFK